jgi:ABC-type sugar transport system permease subunit
MTLIEEPPPRGRTTGSAGEVARGGAGSAAAAARGSGRWWAFQSRFAPYMFVAPFVLLFCFFLLIPLIASVILSFYRYATPQTNQWVGMGHYRFLLSDRLFWIAVWNTTALTIAIVCVQIPASLGLALLLNNPRVRFRNVFRFAFFSSHLVGHVFVAVIFRQILTPRHGLIPRFMGLFSFEATEISWLADPVYGRLAIVLAIFWINIGWGMIYFLAALQAVDRELYEAADVDGAGRWTKFWNVTLPGIKPVLVFMVVVCTISSFQLFELPYMLFADSASEAGPGKAGLTIVMYLYMMGFDLGDIGAASAVGWLLALLIFGVSVLQVKVTGATRDE